jgi:hypothetical protein
MRNPRKFNIARGFLNSRPRSTVCWYTNLLPAYITLSFYYGRRSVDQFVLVSGSPLGPMTRFYLYPFFSDNCFNVLPVGRIMQVTVKYWKNLRTQQSIFSATFYCALLTLHVSAPFSGRPQVVRKHLLNGSVEYTSIVTALDIFFVFTNHLRMAAKRGRNM